MIEMERTPSGIAWLEWQGGKPEPSDLRAVLGFFRQHPRGVRQIDVHTTPGVAPKYEGDPGIPGGQTYLAVTDETGTVRYLHPGVRWTWDGRSFTATRERPEQVKL